MSDSNRSRASRRTLTVYLTDTEYSLLCRMKVRGGFATKNALVKSLLWHAWRESEAIREVQDFLDARQDLKKNTRISGRAADSTDEEELPGQLYGPWLEGGTRGS